MKAKGTDPALSKRQADRATQAKLFFDLAGANGARFITSVFAVEEGFNVLLMRHVQIGARSISAKTWKHYRKINPTSFASDLERGRRAVLEFETMLKVLDVDILAIGKQPHGQQPILEAHLIADAKRLVSALEVDAMDAFHFAIMRRFSIDQAASSDLDWLRFPTGTLYTFS